MKPMDSFSGLCFKMLKIRHTGLHRIPKEANYIEIQFSKY